MAEIKRNSSGKSKSDKKYSSASKSGAKRTSSRKAEKTSTANSKIRTVSKEKKQAKRARKPKVVLSTRKVITLCACICCFCALFLGLSVVLNSVPDENIKETQKIAVETEKENKQAEAKAKPEPEKSSQQKKPEEKSNSSEKAEQKASVQKSNTVAVQKPDFSKSSAQKNSSSDDTSQKKSSAQKSAEKFAPAQKNDSRKSASSSSQKPSSVQANQKNSAAGNSNQKKSSDAQKTSTASASQNQKSSSVSSSKNSVSSQKTAQTQKFSSAKKSEPAKSSSQKSTQPQKTSQTQKSSSQKTSTASNANQKKSTQTANANQKNSAQVASVNSNQNQNAQEQAIKNPRFDIPKAAKEATVVIVIDDAGRSLENVKKYASLPFPLTIAVLPKLPQSRECAQTSIKLGKEVILHQPMQSINHKLDPGPGKITVDMSFSEISSIVNANLDSLGPGVKGMNNHEGSEVTGDVLRIGAVLDVCQKRGIYFLDSRTTAATKAPQAALERDMKIYEKAGPYIDNDLTREKMTERMYETLRYANNHGHAIVIGHVDKSVNILPDLLLEMYPYMKAAGYRFATPSTLHYNYN